MLHSTAQNSSSKNSHFAHTAYPSDATNNQSSSNALQYLMHWQQELQMIQADLKNYVYDIDISQYYSQKPQQTLATKAQDYISKEFEVVQNEHVDRNEASLPTYPSHSKESNRHTSLWSRQGFTPLPYQPMSETIEVNASTIDTSRSKTSVTLNLELDDKLAIPNKEQEIVQKKHPKSPISMTQILIDPLDDDALEASTEMFDHIQTPIAQKLVQATQSHRYEQPSHKDSIAMTYNEVPALEDIEPEAFAGQVSLAPQPQLDELSEGWSTLLDSNESSHDRSDKLKWIMIVLVIIGLGIGVSYLIP